MLRPVLRRIAEYVRDAGRAMIAFLVGATFTLGGLALDLFGVQVPTKLMVFGGAVLMAGGQFWAYYKLRLRHEETEGQLRAARGERPEVDSRLELVEEAPGLTPPDDRRTRETLEVLSVEPLPQHQLSLTLRSTAEIDPPALTVKCDAPIYHAFALYRDPSEEPVMVELARRRQDEIIFAFGSRPLSAGSWFILKMYSPVPVRVRRVGVAVRLSEPSGGPPHRA